MEWIGWEEIPTKTKAAKSGHFGQRLLESEILGGALVGTRRGRV